MNGVLVTGASGQLGSEIQEESVNYPQYQFVFATKSQLDITNFSLVEQFIITNKISVIINCAAYTQVDKAEEEMENATKINFLAVENLGKLAAKLQLKLIHISTDYVFDGTSAKPYKENDTINPKNTYGITKNKGEQALLNLNAANVFIVRTSWLYSSFGQNFVKTILRISKEKKNISVVSDQIGSPTYANDLANFVLKYLIPHNSSKTEIFHYSNQGKCSWFEFASEIVKLSGSSCKVQPISSAEYKSKAYRPPFSLLSLNYTTHTFKITIPTWQNGLANCLEKLNR